MSAPGNYELGVGRFSWHESSEGRNARRAVPDPPPFDAPEADERLPPKLDKAKDALLLAARLGTKYDDAIRLAAVYEAMCTAGAHPEPDKWLARAARNKKAYAMMPVFSTFAGEQLLTEMAPSLGLSADTPPQLVYDVLLEKEGL